LRGENIHRGWRIHWNTGITPVVLLAITIFIGIKFLLR